ncbi:hypothetical protein Hamer_G023480 [Homarus americanus]|uniref:Uncharacterized protein n=1 Tax=Homarus americanus TaxID=6706 RepID=A0A8J5TRJ2_HOMAM|nr:hypothetical protein Hamer_G023480 [Homarus americanus]
MMDSFPYTLLLTAITLLSGVLVEGCNMATKEVGVCLHVYLERDFLTMERIVYPRRSAKRREMLYNSYAGARSLRLLPRLPQLGDLTTEASVAQTTDARQSPDMKTNQGVEQSQDVNPKPGVEHKPGTLQMMSVGEDVKGRHNHRLLTDDGNWTRVSPSPPDNYAVIDAYGQHGWVEGPELEDYCRYRHLLHALERVHTYLCRTAADRSSKFLPFLKVIDCAENARLDRGSCHRPNVTVNVWNQILRLELGPELCDSLNTQRSCLLENEYVRQECGGKAKEELYKNVSGVFLATWCRLPLPPHLSQLFVSSSPPPSAASFTPLLLLLFLQAVLTTS